MLFALAVVAGIGVRAIGLHQPLAPWAFMNRLVFGSLPFAAVFVYFSKAAKLHLALGWLLSLVVVTADSMFLWIFCAVVLVSLAALNTANAVANPWRLQPILLSFAAITFFQITLANVNYLLAHIIPLSAFQDPSLKAFDVWFYSLFAHKPVEYAGLFPMVHDATLLRILDNAYDKLFAEIILVLILVCKNENLRGTKEFLLQYMGLYALGVITFMIYPVFQPTVYFPESVNAALTHGTSLIYISKIGEDYHSAVAGGGPLNGYAYFIGLPSLHVMLALFLQIRLRPYPVLFRVLLPLNIAIVLSTFLLGYHYILDVGAACLFMAVAAVYNARMNRFRMAHLASDVSTQGVAARRGRRKRLFRSSHKVL